MLQQNKPFASSCLLHTKLQPKKKPFCNESILYQAIDLEHPVAPHTVCFSFTSQYWQKNLVFFAINYFPAYKYCKMDYDLCFCTTFQNWLAGISCWHQLEKGYPQSTHIEVLIKALYESSCFLNGLNHNAAKKFRVKLFPWSNR